LIEAILIPLSGNYLDYYDGQITAARILHFTVSSWGGSFNLIVSIKKAKHNIIGVFYPDSSRLDVSREMRENDRVR